MTFHKRYIRNYYVVTIKYKNYSIDDDKQTLYKTFYS